MINRRLVLALVVLAPSFVRLERRAQGRLGVYAIDLRTGSTTTYRADERFPVLSTFKLPLVVLALHRLDLARSLAIAPADLVPNSPVVGQHLAAGDRAMTVRDLCSAAVRYSDNTAANVLLAQVGGPAGLTAWMRMIGDSVFRLDHIEPTLNEQPPGDPRDTSTPRAMGTFVRRLVEGDLLPDSSRALVLEWMRTNTTGDARLRAGAPAGWTVGDKTGTAERRKNDIAFLSAPDGRTIIIATYLTETMAPDSVGNGVLAEVARVTARE